MLEVKINDNHIGEVQSLYHNNGTIDELIDISNGNITRTPVDSITNISADPFRDSITIERESAGKPKSTHAMERIGAHVDGRLVRNEGAVQRFQAGMTSLVVGAVGGAGLYYVLDSIVLVLLLAFMLFMVLKPFMKRVFDR